MRSCFWIKSYTNKNVCCSTNSNKNKTKEYVNKLECLYWAKWYSHLKNVVWRLQNMQSCFCREKCWRSNYLDTIIIALWRKGFRTNKDKTKRKTKFHSSRLDQSSSFSAFFLRVTTSLHFKSKLMEVSVINWIRDIL